jgi:hypothetical protein
VKETRILRNIPVWDRKSEQRVLIDIDVEVDINWIGQQLALKAYNNDNRKSRALHGLVEVRVRGTKATPLATAEDA